MKRHYVHHCFFIILLSILTVSCTLSSEFDFDHARTLASLRKVDDFPLYVMRFYGDYDPLSMVINRVLPEERQNVYVSEPLLDWACTCFSVLHPGCDPLFGRNFDWYDHPALLLFTSPSSGYSSVSMVDISYLGYSKNRSPHSDPDRLFESPSIPFDGMNEYGLAVGMMAVPAGQPPRDNKKKTIGSLLAIRMMLDYAKNVDEAISVLRQYNIDFEMGPPVHYMVADSSGNSAVIEFVSGSMNVMKNEYTWQVATNFLLTGKDPEDACNLCWRYSRAWNLLKEESGSFSPETALSLLEEVSQSSTIWTIVYNLKDLTIHVAMGRKYDKVHPFRLDWY